MSKKLHRVLILTVVLIVVALALASCKSDKKKEKAKTQTSIQLSWLHSVEYAGFYEALDRGYYTNESLEVRLDAGGFDANGAYIDPVQRVVDGQSDFGIAGADVILAQRAQGKPVVAVAAIYQHSPVVLITLGEKNIVRPQDLVGKRVATQPESSTVGIGYRALLTSQKVDRSQIIEMPNVDSTNVDALFNGDVDVTPGFVTNQGVQAQLRSKDTVLILLSDYGIDIYSNVIFTTEDTIANKPALVESFLRATLQGYDKAIEDTAHAAGLALKYDAKLDLTTQTASMQTAVPLLKPVGSKTGMMQVKDWDFAYQTLLDQGILTQPLDVNKAYTLDFLNKIYK